MARPVARGKPWLEGAADAALLTTAEMYRADVAAIASGVLGPRLMEAAGAAVAQEVLRRWTPRPALMLCGPGNNGGDGFVAARLLAEAGWPVRVALLGAREKLKGDAAWAASTWSGPTEPLKPESLEGAEFVIDALFGAGLDRALDGVARATIEALAAQRIPVLAVDVPSGVSGDTGTVLGAAAQAEATVTFFRKKPGHLLRPGRGLCGDIVVADIGIPPAVLAEIAPRTAENGPALWRGALPVPKPGDHKYTRGHVVVIAGEMTGAARLAAMGAARIGAGMVTVLAPAASLPMLAALPAAIIVSARPKAPALGEWLRQRKAAAVLIGPGLGLTSEARAYINACLGSGLPAVLDADALTAFADNAKGLARARAATTVLTPHAGEFARVFGGGDGPGTGDRLARARAAAADTGAILVAKANDTIIAAPDGRAAINANAPPWLASAGTGDVLAGMIAGLLGQGMPAFEAASAAVWLHGERAADRGQNLIADDLVNASFTFPVHSAPARYDPLRWSLPVTFHSPIRVTISAKTGPSMQAQIALIVARPKPRKDGERPLGSGATGHMALLLRRNASGQVECGDKFRRIRVDQTVETAEVKTIYRDLLGIPHVRFELNLEHPYRGPQREGLRALALSVFSSHFPERVPA